LAEDRVARNTYVYYTRRCEVALTVRLSPKTERALNALVKRQRQSRSDIVREALAHYTRSLRSAMRVPGARTTPGWMSLV